MPTAVDVIAVAKGYGRRPVLVRADLDVAPGETVAVVGPSGCGKTTLLRLIAGLELPDAGEIRLAGQIASRAGWALVPHRRGVAFAFQTPALWPHMTVLQNVLFGLGGSPRAAAIARARDLLDRMAVADIASRYPDQISAGQARRVSLARAVAPRRPCLLLDEPLVNVENDVKERLIALLRDDAREAAVVLVTHDPDEALALADRVVPLYSGVLGEPSAADRPVGT